MLGSTSGFLNLSMSSYWTPSATGGAEITDFLRSAGSAYAGSSDLSPVSPPAVLCGVTGETVGGVCCAGGKSGSCW